MFKFGAVARSVVLVLFLIFTLGGHAFQIPSIFEVVSVELPIEGQIIWDNDGRLVSMDGQTGAFQIIAEDSSDTYFPMLTHEGTRINYYTGYPAKFESVEQWVMQNMLLNLTDGSSENLSTVKSHSISGWASSTPNTLYYYYYVFSPREPLRHKFEQFDLTTHTYQTIKEWSHPAVLPIEATARAAATTYEVWAYRGMFVHPQMSHWVLLLAEAHDLQSDEMVEGADGLERKSVYDLLFWNTQTDKYYSLKAATGLEANFDAQGYLQAGWDPEGKRVGFDATDRSQGLTSVRFAEGAEGTALLRVESIESTSDTDEYFHVFDGWLGVEDLMITVPNVLRRDTAQKQSYDYVVAQVQNGTLYTRPLVTLSAESNASYVGVRFTGGEAEKARLSCLFDQTLAPQLAAGARGQVTFTDGTPSRLRSDHYTDAEVITQMAEGTAFEVTGAPYCADGYRWLPLRLDDGTEGWAADA